MSELLGCFKAYDIRGRVPDDLDAGLARRIGRAYAEALSPGRVALGRDIRLSSPEIAAAVADGLRDGGVDVLDIGVVGTEEVYFATFHYGLDGGIMVTASHNPRDHNGMKLVREGARPISGDSGLGDIERLAAGPELVVRPRRGGLEAFDHRSDYVEHLLGSIDTATLAPLKVVVNAGNGGAGVVVDALAPRLPFELVRVHHEPDGHFPNGVPNPLVEASRAVTATAVTHSGADLGVAWDGDFDRCFFFDEQGRFIEGYYIVGLLAELFLRRSPGERVIHDPRLTWNTIDLCRAFGGEAVQCKTGHAFIKERMRAEDAIYGGEMSAHHYFRDFAYCDSGMLPWLLVAELIGRTGKPLSQLVDERIERFPASGEINREIDDPAAAIAAVEAEYGADAVAVDHTDGVSIELADWRFNLRMSNTEPVVRLNVETRGDRALMHAKTDELIARLDAFAHG
ncbi:phosphomannomutase/phosphoglucomutase [Arhodomonas aquaeolei]|uniref:phosphomannomutase/phosphoglucomutase n=1 Tax=Arhodomonas aquaeolei TaxID=2369 RepID=UPI00036BE2FA|nr:phosphomannomutase/phosphoglucomutase [Arhodomonas aquaeolei]